MENNIISGEEHYNQVHQQEYKKPKSRFSYIAIPVALILFLIIGFSSGQYYQKQKDKSNLVTLSASAAGPTTSGGPMLSAGGNITSGSNASGSSSGSCVAMNIDGKTVQSCGAAPVIGQVMAISQNSIEVQTSSSAQSYSLTGTTPISDNGQAVTYTDIKIGDTVSMIVSPTSANQIIGIIVNPKQTPTTVPASN